MTDTAGEHLRDRLRSVRDSLDEANATRLHRAVSWLRCAEQYSETDEDISFISLWISFNSLYSIYDNRIDHSFRDDFDQFTRKLIRLDEDGRIYHCLWTNFSGFVRLLIDNKYVYGPFWHSRRDGNEDWAKPFEASRRRANRALANNDVQTLLRIIMERLYVLRNQLVHGGATWRSRVNRDQVRDGKRVLLELVPIFIEIMFDESEDWGQIHYPVVS